MTISNAIPVQFWLNGVESYNQKILFGIEPVCFSQKFKSTDTIALQFSDTHYGAYFTLDILDKYDLVLQSLLFTEISTGVYFLSFIPSTYSLSDTHIYFKINRSSQVITGEFTTSLETWVNVGAGVNSWAWNGANGGCALISYNPFSSTGKSLKRILAIGTLGDCEVTVNCAFTGDSGTASLTLIIKDATELIDLYTSANITGTGATFTIPAASINGGAYVYIRPNGTLNQVYSWYLNSISGIIGYGEEAYSDEVHITDSTDDISIQYTNTDDFNGINYLTSPSPSFTLRIPAQFWKEDNPMEQEDSELSNGVIKTRRQSIQEKRLLEIGYLPNYMHKKMQMVLMHDSVTIDGNLWKKRDAYESENINRYPLKRANVWLTLYNSIEDNIV